MLLLGPFHISTPLPQLPLSQHNIRLCHRRMRTCLSLRRRCLRLVPSHSYAHTQTLRQPPLNSSSSGAAVSYRMLLNWLWLRQACMGGLKCAAVAPLWGLWNRRWNWCTPGPLLQNEQVCAA